MNLKVEDKKVIAVPDEPQTEDLCGQCFYPVSDCRCGFGEDDAAASELVDLPFVVFNLGRLED